LNQRYVSKAVYPNGSEEIPPLPTDPNLYYEPHTFPGGRLPHVWLNTSVPGAQISTLDLAGKGRFSLFISWDGEEWRSGAKVVSEKLGVGIVVFAIGMGLEYEAVYRDWYNLREVDDDGYVLVRPDRSVAWKSKTLTKDCEADLERVMKSILSLQ
jgi:hypothetical protein